MNSPPRGADSLFRTFVVLLSLHALAAYSIGPIPLQWVALAGFNLLATWIVTRRFVPIFPGLALFVVFLMWASFITVVKTVGHDVSYLVPERATTGYLTYVGLRFMNLWAFCAVAVVSYIFFKWFSARRQVEVLVNLGVLLSLYALYVYVAQIIGLPEIPRTRIGTDGGEQMTRFSYAFHRAMGSFREPSHLAEWLVFPFFLSFISNKHSMLKTMIMLATIFLTGSLTGLISIGIGLCLALAFNISRLTEVLSRLLRFVPALVVAAIVVSFFLSSGKGVSDKGLGDMISTISDRVKPLLQDEGLEKSNRNYVYNYLRDHKMDVWGEGIGNSNLIFGKVQGSDATASFLNLYINTLYSTGLIGLLILIMLLAYPILLQVYRSTGSSEPQLIYVWAAYYAWLVIFFVHTEELSVHFGIIYALLVYAIPAYARGQKVFAHASSR